MSQTVIASANNQELTELPGHDDQSGEAQGSHAQTSVLEENAQTLPPHDRGRAAWSLLLAAFVFEASLWGFPLSFGVFQDYYSHLSEFKHDPYVSVIGTVASGLSYMAAPIVIPLVKRFSKYRRHMIFIGWPICLLGLVAGSFARSLGSLIFTQGVMYGVGFIIFYYPILSMVNEYWIARRGMAYGFLCSASGVSGAAMPFVLERLLQRYGYPTTLRIVAVALFILTGPLIPFLKGRLPESGASASGRTDWSFLKTPLFWIYSASNFAMGLGYFFPSLYIPSYATLNSLSSTKGALLLAMMSVSQVCGQMSFGYLSDRKLPLDVLTVSSTLVAGVAAYMCWGFAHTFDIMVVFALLYGFFGAGYTSLWGRMGMKISSEPSAAFTAFGLLNFGKGVGNVLAGPLSGALLKTGVNVKQYGSMRYQEVILFTGSCMIVSATTIIASHLYDWKKRRYLP